MDWQSTPWADPLLFSTVVSASLAVFGLLYVALLRRDRRVVAFATLMVGAAVWTLGYSFQFASATLPGKRTWATVAMLGTAVVPVAWATFAAAYARSETWLRPRRLALLWAIPAATVLLTLTNGTHGLLWQGGRLVPAPDGGYLVLERTAGPWMLLQGGYSYLLSFAGLALLVGQIGRSRRLYRGQAAVLLVGILVPAAAHLASLSGVGPTAVVDLTPASLPVLGVAFAVAIFRYRLFDLVPVARSSVVENMGEGYVLLDGTGAVVDLNAAARSLLDGDDGQLIGRDARAAFGADLSVLESFDGTQTTETVETTDGRSRQYIQLTVSTVDADRVAGRLVAVRDVTDRVRLEQRFQRLIEASSDVVFVLDDAGVVEYASPSVRRVLGYDPDALADETAFEELIVTDAEGPTGSVEPDDPGSVGPESADPHAADAGASTMVTASETWHRILEGTAADSSDATTRFEVRMRTADGATRVIEAIARYLVEDPAVEGIVINARDVTERKRRELELQRTNERLDRFASLVSHDLRNPLQVAKGNLELARMETDTEPLERVQQQHERMETMIEELLSMARDGRTVTDPSPVALDRLARRAWDGVETEGASLVVDTDTRVLADESRLLNLFENLYRNAVEHGVPDGGDAGPAAASDGGTDASGLSVCVETTPDGFAVGDDGVGIPEDRRETVFESGHTTRPGNTGFGLAIVEEVASAHGWTVRATESESGGARFEVTGVDTPGAGTDVDTPGAGTTGGDDVVATAATGGETGDADGPTGGPKTTEEGE